MKQSTSFAQVANNLLNVLQGYTKGIRFLLVIFLTLTVSAEVWGQTWQKATSIAAGDVVLLVCESKNMELSGISTTSTKYGTGVSYTTSPAGKYELTVETGSSSGTYSLKNGSNYLYWSSGNSLATNATKNANTSWSITFSNGNATIKNAEDNSRIIGWNASSPRFACYTSSQTAVQLYKKVISKTLSSISISGQTTTFTVGDTFKFGGTVTATYSDKSNKDVTSSATFSGYNMSSAATQTVEVSYTEGGITKTTTYDITVTAPTGGGNESECDKWVEVQLADIVPTDEVVICMEKQGVLWALPNDGGTSTPTAVVITSDDFSSKNGIGSSLKWNIKNNNGTLEIYPNGTTSKWLYCTNSNSGVRVGTEDNKTFTIADNYLKHTTTARYVGVYVANPDWRCYTSTTGNIVNQTLKFYKYVECITETAPSLNASESSLSFGEVTVNSSKELTFKLSGSDLKADAKLAISGTDKGRFSVTPTSVTPSNGSFTDKTITVTYTPTAKDSHSATLTISSEDAEDVTISLSGTGKAQMANYTVKHYQQNLDGTYPTTPTDTETLSGEVGATVTPAVKTTYTGFTKPDAKTVTIASDGTTVVEYQYTRNSYTLTWDVNEGNALTGSYTSGNVKYGAAITKPADPTREGYVFKGWHNGTSIVTPATTMPASNLTYTAQWTPTYTITWLANGQEFYKQENAVEGTALDVPDSEPDASEYACDDKVFVGWTATQIDGSTDTEPADLFTTKNINVEAASTTYYAVFATAEGDGGSAGETTTVALGDQVVIIQIDDEKTELAGFRSDKVITDNNNYGTYAAYSTTPSATLVWTVEEGASDGTFAFKNGNYYLNLGGNDNYLSCSTTKNTSSSWTVTESSDRAVVTNLMYNSRKIMWNQSSPRFASYAKNHGLNTNQYYYHIKFYKLNGAVSYSEYTTTCVKLPDPVLSFATEPANPVVFTDAVCGGNSSKQSVTVVGENLRDVVNVSVTGPYKIARTASTALKDFNTSLTLDKTAAGAIHSNYQTVYIISTPPAQSTEATTGTLTFTTTKGNTLIVNLSTPTVTCTQYTLTLVDRGVSTEQPTKYYAGETIDEAPADPEGVCTDPIHYVFDGWAETTVTNGSTGYTPVSFPYTVTGNTKFYAVYRYTGDGGEPSNDFIKVTSAKDDWTGDYVIVDEDAEKAIGNAYQTTNTLKAIDVEITDNKVISPSNDIIWQIRKHGENYTMYNASANKYAYIAKADAKGAGLSATTTNTTQDIQIIFNNGTAKVSGVDIYRCFYYYGTNTEWRTYATGNYNTGALYCRSLESYLYTTSPVCGPHLAITEGKDIYVTGGNAGGTRDLVIAQQKVSYKATRLNVGPTSQVPDVKVATNGITVGGVVTSDVKVTIDQTKEQQTDGTYTITGTITVQYQPSANNKQKDIQVQLAVDYNAEARDNFIVHARSLPSEFVIVAKSGDKWYALNGDMNNGSSANPANGQVTLDDDANPTKATYAPCNTIYTFDGVPNTGDRTRVRFQGTDGAWLWAASGTNVGIQNKSLKDTPEGDNKAYNWKLETEDNITYKFHNDNSSRLLGLSGEKFGMYASAVQELRILPYIEKCLYNYAPSNLKVSVLKGTYVTLTWDAVAGATKYQYSTNGTTWTDAGTEPTVTINGLTGATKYTYYIRAYHEDAGVSQECIDYAEITFTTADCDDVPTDITYSADMNSITVSWTAAAPTATIKLFMDAEGTHMAGSYPDATSPYRISGGLKKNTTYYIQILADGTCASPIVPVKTEDVEVDIVEWQPQGIVVDINTDETIGVTLENEVSYGSGSGSLAEDLFFSKYFEGSGSLKMIAIYNGTGKDVNLSEYRIDRGSNGDATNISKTYDLSQLGVIKQGQEIIFYSWPLTSEDSYSCSQSFLDSKAQESGLDANPRWILCDAKTHSGIEFEAMDFSGDDPLLFYKGNTLIDVFGVSTAAERPSQKTMCDGRSDNSWSANEVTNMDYGKTTEDFPNGEIPYGVNVDDETITAYTARVIMFRKNTVVSGKNAVTKNTTTFATFADEWEARQVCRSGDDGDLTCAAYQELGTFDYSEYYTKYESMGDEQIFDANKRNEDGTVTVEILNLDKQSCRNIRVKLTNSNGDVLSDREYKVPIMITTTQGTDGQAFLALQENLATVEIDGNGNPTGNKTNLTLEQVREICKTCDVVIRDNATLMKMADDAANDHPEVHDIFVYENSSLIVPNGTNYTINNLSLRRKQDAVASLNVHPDALKLPESAAAPISLDFRLSAESWHWFTLPFDCNISEVTWIDGSTAQYNVDWFLMTYDGEKRAATQAGGCWKAYTGTTIRAGEGFILAINGNINNPAHTYELRFPMSKEVLAAEGTDKTVAVRAWGVETNIRPNHKGWNLVGNPYLAYYQRNNITNFEGLRLGQLVGPDPQTGYWEQTGEVPYVVVPVGAGWVAYEQVLASDIDLLPFTAYFVQVGKDGTHNSDQDLKVSFDHSKLQLSATPMPASIIQRSASEMEEPVIVGVSLTNAKGESDKTSLIIDDQYTDEYEMNADFFKWFGDYYKYYTKPVLYTIGADQGKRAFNAISEDLAAQPISLGMYVAQTGNYTFSLDLRSDLSKVQEVWLYDATQDTYTNLLQDSYTFQTAKTESAGRFFLSVKMAPKVSTNIDNIADGTIWATTQDHTIFVNGLLSNAQLWIYDATGKLLHTDQTQYFQHSYSVPINGTYFIKVQNTMHTQTIKVVVE